MCGLIVRKNSKSQQYYWYGLLVISFAFYFLSGMFELYPRVGWVDAGMYMGYSNNMKELVHEYGFSPHNYQGSRLGYLLPSQVLSYLLGPVTGRYVFVILFYYAVLMALWLAAKKSLPQDGRRVLFLAFIACNPIYLSAIAFGGADGPTMAYVILAGFCWLYSDRKNPINNFWLALSGIFAAFAVSSHLFAIVPLGIIYSAVYVFQVNYWRSIIPVALAFVLSIFIFGRIGFNLGFEKNYLEYSYSWAFSSVKMGSGESYRKPFIVWLKTASIWLPVILLSILTAARLFIYRLRIYNNSIFSAMVLIVFPVIFVLLYDVILGGSISQYLSYYVIIVLPCFSFSLLLFMSDDIFVSATFQVWLAALLFFCCVILAALNVGVTIAALVISIVFSLGALYAYYGILDEFIAKPLLMYSCLAVLVFCEFCFAYNQAITAVYSKASKGNTKELIKAETQFMSAIKSIPETRISLGFIYDGSKGKYPDIGRNYSIYFSKEERVFTYFDSLTSLYLWDRTIISGNLSSEELENYIPLVDKRKTIVTLTDSMAGINEISTRLMHVSSHYKSIYVTCYQSEVYPWCMQAYRYE